jgi:putative ATP-binding cassette transporter
MRRGSVFVYALRLSGSYFFVNYRAGLLLSSVAGLNLLLAYILVEMNFWQARFYNFLQEKEVGLFFKSLAFYGLLAAAVAFIKGVQVHCRFFLHIGWREWLTEKFMDEWLDKKTYYRLQFAKGSHHENPDQRMSEDIDLFISLTLRLFLECMQDAVIVASFIFILWDLSDVLAVSVGGLEFKIRGYLVWAAAVYAFFGTYLTLKAGAPLVKLDYMQQKHEADFRFSLIRIREYAESVAFYQGEGAEKSLCGRVFFELKKNFAAIIAMRRLLAWISSAYSNGAVLYAFAVAAPRYFSGKLALGQLFQIIDAFNQVQSGMSFLIDSFTRIAQWKAVVYRLHYFWQSMENSKTGGKNHSRGRANSLAVGSLFVKTPQGKSLAENVNFSLEEGSRMIITGNSGCGKSTLLRSLAGLWDFKSADFIDLPKGALFVPQKPYMPLATLRQVLSYPNLDKSFSDTEIKDALNECSISHLAARLDEGGDWSKILSLGEQQRLAFARIFLQKPRVIFLDEATAALDEKNQQLMYERLTMQLTDSIVVSVAHRESLLKFHDVMLKLDGSGGWQLVKIAANDVHCLQRSRGKYKIESSKILKGRSHEGKYNGKHEEYAGKNAGVCRAGCKNGGEPAKGADLGHKFAD